ncbi:hypothetical protein POM88_033761 [Heracleum sosnowskyi]|uniref:Uncharacterized protein n=1 Tax=Heracleum sosnowskyi TaxID=360622 RepID=A0AAD8MCG3_9APIA|nr:hypothetical protein POM88_033761 [Heracleum sosnowskyi]
MGLDLEAYMSHRSFLVMVFVPLFLECVVNSCSSFLTIRDFKKIDNHRKDQKEITLEDQNLTGQDSFRIVSFNEDLRNSLSCRDYSVTLLGGMSIGVEHPDPSNHERLELLSDNNGPLSYPRTEIMRDVSLQHFSENDLLGRSK